MTNKINLDSDYDKAGFGGNLQLGQKPALLLIDFAKAYITKDCGLYAGVEASAKSALTLLTAARTAGIMIVFTRVEFTQGGADGGVFYRKVPALKNFVKGNPMAEFVEELEPKPGEIVITKQYASAFFGTNLASTLAAASIDTLLISGWSTSGCVRASTLDACQSGFVPIVVREAVGDRDTRPHESNLFDLQAKYAEVMSINPVINYLETL
ncbi:MAG: isochorismatase [Rhodospirillaceae bacterium]|nr:isochorismatase [Rhodospirillaceae bacterium]